ncbi:CBS domain-containing protein [Natronococcus jeotgali]|uniref:CBS domain containing protein n=1 Tax=Natronococcus jeotgali DSM 18795 TaxID=1227498 RepID=L9WUJ1_9EURY|nr:CBS domain-containing protein [Natronococcus jeotgali]ELY53149.1 CBS domain containing protein [Natronococcus jeotgali DSM 18795]
MEQELSVREVLTTEYVGVSESDSVLETVRLMREERAGCVLVVRGSEPVGIMTEWDVLGLVAEEGDPADTTVGEVMTSPVITVGAGWSLADAATTMGRQNIRNLVVESDDGIVGVLTQRDVIAAAGSFQGATSGTVEPPLEADRPIDQSRSPGPGEDLDAEPLPNGGDEFSTQGVCEACGSLADSLWDANGRLVCSDCRSV